MRDWLLLGALCVLGALIGRGQTASRNRGDFFPLDRGVATLVAPASVTVRSIASTIESVSYGALHGKQLLSENDRLRETIKRLRSENSASSDLEAENERLRSLMGFRKEERTSIPAKVIGYFPYEDRFTIDAGERDQVRVGLPVVTSDGLLGIIQSVAPKRSQVLLLSSPFVQIGALIDRDPPQAGILQGTGTGRSFVDFTDPTTPLSVGDKVVTSGFSEKIPRGIPIGSVVQTRDDADFGVRRAEVFASAGIGSTREVVVLR